MAERPADVFGVHELINLDPSERVKVLTDMGIGTRDAIEVSDNIDSGAELISAYSVAELGDVLNIRSGEMCIKAGHAMLDTGLSTEELAARLGHIIENTSIGMALVARRLMKLGAN